MKATTKRALVAAAFGLALAAGSLGLAVDEAHARVIRPVMCTPYECKYSVIEDVVEPAEPGAEQAEFVIARMCLYCVR